MEFLSVLISCNRFTILSGGTEHWALLEKLLDQLTHPAGNLFFDIRTAVLMKEHGIRTIYTTDTDFLQFPEIEVVNPLK
jgi:predicted nucleic acid-binding protein